MTNADERGDKFADWMKRNPFWGKAIAWLILILFAVFIAYGVWLFFRDLADRLAHGKIISTIFMLAGIALGGWSARGKAIAKSKTNSEVR